MKSNEALLWGVLRASFDPSGMTIDACTSQIEILFLCDLFFLSLGFVTSKLALYYLDFSYFI